MERSKSVKVSAMALVAAMVMAPAMPAFAAAGTNYSGTIGGETTTTFDKYLVMDAQEEVPNATFSYEVTAGTAKS